MTPAQREMVRKLIEPVQFVPGDTVDLWFVTGLAVKDDDYELTAEQAEYLEKMFPRYNTSGLVCPECNQVIEGLLWRLTKHDQPHCIKCAYTFIFGQRGQLPR